MLRPRVPGPALSGGAGPGTPDPSTPVLRTSAQDDTERTGNSVTPSNRLAAASVRKADERQTCRQLQQLKKNAAALRGHEMKQNHSSLYEKGARMNDYASLRKRKSSVLGIVVILLLVVELFGLSMLASRITTMSAAKKTDLVISLTEGSAAGLRLFDFFLYLMFALEGKIEYIISQLRLISPADRGSGDGNEALRRWKSAEKRGCYP